MLTEQMYKTLPDGVLLMFWIACSFVVSTLVSILKFRFYCLSKEEMRAPFPDGSI
jgi:hypothetical protein